MKMTAKFLALLKERLDSASHDERMGDYVVGAGLALDPLPASLEATFEARDWRALYADKEAFAKDLRAAFNVFVSFNNADAINMLKAYAVRKAELGHFKVDQVKPLNGWNKEASNLHGETRRQTEKSYSVS
jgi:hypothetical protein